MDDVGLHSAELLVTTTPVPPQRFRGLLQHQNAILSLPPKADLVLVGDSLIRNWPESLWNGWPGNVVNLGAVGDRVQNVLWRITQPEISDLHPRAVILLAGTNNLRLDRPRAIVLGLELIIKTLTSLWPTAELHAIEIPPRGLRYSEARSERMEVNTSLRSMRETGALSSTMNIDLTITDNRTYPSPNYQKDNLHFTALGYSKIMPIVRRRLEPTYRALTPLK
ncbi:MULTISPECIES: GDSL-type esterase/lipase family protein [Agrobacterium]|uniref:GDSL-type esterase/lipase family protein n=1 Tax=Agrobacterium tumefaciens TaxID=358 RepID=UPI00122FFC44|nr:hypothetical protein DXM26_16820 [Agrobacterium tumefaciens]